MLTNERNKAIGIFDSGLGGLNILRGIKADLPNYDYTYLGDNARVPYGSRSPEIIYRFTKQAIDFLFRKNCELVIVACNTASAQALRKIQQEYLPRHCPEKKVLGVIIPTVEYVLKTKERKRVGVIGTQRTIDSKVFVHECIKLRPEINVFQQACPLLVPLIEFGEKHEKAVDIILEEYLNPLLKKNIDSLILGCTHYGVWSRKIREIMGENVCVFSEEEIIPGKLENYLYRHPEIEKKINQSGKLQFYSTDPSNNFSLLGEKFFGGKINFQKVDFFS